MSTKIQSGSSTAGLANVDSAYQVLVAPEKAPLTNPSNVGAVKIYSENDPGEKTGTPYLRAPETSTDYRLRTGIDSLWDNESFNYAAQNTSKHNYTNTTLTITYGGGSITTNGGSGTAINTGAYLRTYRQFPLFGTASTYVDFDFCIADAIATNTEVYYGFFTPTSQTAAPADGVYFKITSAGFFACTNNAGSENAVAFTFAPTINQTYRLTIALNHSEVEFWIDSVLYAEVPTPAGLGTPCSSLALPVCIQHRILGTAAGTVFRTKCFNYNVTIGDLDNNRLWASAMAGMGFSSIQGASGQTQGQTSNNANSAAPESASLSNTAAGYTTLGGQFQFAAVGGAETDYALFAFLNTAATTAITGRNLVVRGVWIDTFNMGAASATTPTLLQWSLGAGSTAVSLATGESAVARAPRRISLGTQSIAVATAVGGQSDRRIDVNLDAPVVVEPGTYLHIILKMPVGTATASQIIRGTVGINGYWE